VFGVFLSNALLGESITPGLITSVILVGAGIAVVNHEA
jgi:drug/metabolite transporter (DMT)-like permease